jgi:hypothetical protein
MNRGSAKRDKATAEPAGRRGLTGVDGPTSGEGKILCERGRLVGTVGTATILG